jgi:hypothetical protein
MDEISVKAGATTADKDEENPKGWYAEVLKTTAVVALYPKPLDAVAMHREVEKAKAGVQVWSEDVGRFTTEEMVFALVALDQALLQPYSLAYYYTSQATANFICERGSGIDPWCGTSACEPERAKLMAAKKELGQEKDKAAKTNLQVAVKTAQEELRKAQDEAKANERTTGERSDIVVCTKSPVDLEWDKNGGGNFKQRVKDNICLVGPPGKLAVMVVAVPTAVLEDGRNHKSDGLCTIPSKFLVGTRGQIMYSNAHIQKCYHLGCDDVIQPIPPSDDADAEAPAVGTMDATVPASNAGAPVPSEAEAIPRSGTPPPRPQATSSAPRSTTPPSRGRP